MDTQELIESIRAATTSVDIEQLRAAITAMPEKMPPELKAALLDKLAEFTAQSQASRDDIAATLRVHGVDYPLLDWLTPKNYARQFGIKNVETIINWINRGIIPAENVKEIPEFGLRLIKAVEYTPRTYSASAEKDAA